MEGMPNYKQIRESVIPGCAEGYSISVFEQKCKPTPKCPRGRKVRGGSQYRFDPGNHLIVPICTQGRSADGVMCHIDLPYVTLFKMLAPSGVIKKLLQIDILWW
jgi:hypothetical protein